MVAPSTQSHSFHGGPSMARKKAAKTPKPAQRKITVGSYSRRFNAAKLPPRGQKGRFRKRGPAQTKLF